MDVQRSQGDLSWRCELPQAMQQDYGIDAAGQSRDEPLSGDNTPVEAALDGSMQNLSGLAL